MPTATIKFQDREVTLADGKTTIGRTSDNKISFPEDSNVSRYHAEIENRDGEFWLTDLGSSNGTQVNGEPVSGSRKIENNSEIMLGGSSRLAVSIEEDKAEEEEESADA